MKGLRYNGTHIWAIFGGMGGKAGMTGSQLDLETGYTR